jgi:sulfur relay (sulfurtransferase) complex TusBCD TusD component (DsrE family)
MGLSAVFFREEGVYHALAGRSTDAGTPENVKGWTEISKQSQAPLLLCSSSSQRRLESAPAKPFREAGLAELMELMASSDRVVTL